MKKKAKRNVLKSSKQQLVACAPKVEDQLRNALKPKGAFVFLSGPTGNLVHLKGLCVCIEEGSCVYVYSI